MVGHVAPYKIKKECHLLRRCLVDAKGMLLFMVEQHPSDGGGLVDA